MFGNDFLDLKNEPVSSILPQGDYKVQCEKVELKTTKAGTGKYINAQFNVVSEEGKGRKVFHMFNVENPSNQAQTIGRTQLKSVMESAGLSPQLAVGKSYQEVAAILLNQVVGIKLKHRENTWNGVTEMKEAISYFYPVTAEGKKMATSNASAASVVSNSDGATAPAPF